MPIFKPVKYHNHTKTLAALRNQNLPGVPIMTPQSETQVEKFD